MPIYLDNHATTRVDDRVVSAMLPYFTERFGNAASRSHAFGWEAEEAVDAAREQVGRLIGARRPRQEIIFTSGATESDNLAIKGVAHFLRDRGDHVVTVTTEHKAVLDSARRLEREGFRVTYVPVDSTGRVDPEEIRRAIDDRTILVSVMHVNNEVGTVQPIRAIGAIVRERSVLFHCDAVQGLGYVPFDVEKFNVDLASVSAHKIYGPKGVGALFVRRSGPKRARLIAEMDGGGHEQGLRSGTLNVPAIVGFGRAAEIMREEGASEAERIRQLRVRLWEELQGNVSAIVMNGAEDPARHPGNLNVSFNYVEGEALILALHKKLAVSSGSACTSASVEPSYVLRAMGRETHLADASIRFGLGRFTTEDEVVRAARYVIRQVAKLRESNELWRLKEQGVDPEAIDW